MLQKLKEKLFGCAKHLGVFACLYLVTAGLDALVTGTVEPKGLYLFGWTTHESYWGLWLLSPVLVLLGQNVWARFVTGGNVLAVIVGQFVGDWVEKTLPPDPYGTRRAFHADVHATPTGFPAKGTDCPHGPHFE